MKKLIYIIVILVSVAALAADAYLAVRIMKNRTAAVAASVEAEEPEEKPETKEAEEAKETEETEEAEGSRTAETAEDPGESRETPVEEEPAEEAVTPDFSGPYDCIFYPPEHAVDIDTDGCATFEDVVGRLKPDQAYAYVYVSGEQVLLITDQVIPDIGDILYAFTADAYCYDSDGRLTFCGGLSTFGSGYAIRVDGGLLSLACNHYTQTLALDHYRLVTAETCYEDPDDGKYVYYSSDGGDYSDLDQAYAGMFYDAMFDMYFHDAMIVDFTKI